MQPIHDAGSDPDLVHHHRVGLELVPEADEGGRPLPWGSCCRAPPPASTPGHGGTRSPSGPSDALRGVAADDQRAVSIPKAFFCARATRLGEISGFAVGDWKASSGTAGYSWSNSHSNPAP